MPEYYINEKTYSQEEIEALDWEKLCLTSLRERPNKFYKYFPNTVEKEKGRNYSVEALENNTVYLQNPTVFDDPYDSTISIDVQELALRRILYYANWCWLSNKFDWTYDQIINEFVNFLKQKIDAGITLETIFKIKNDNNDKVDLIHHNFIKKLQIESQYSWQAALHKAIYEEYKFLCTSLQRFRISCFTTSPYSILMWSHYANSHKGFCIEYDNFFDLNEKQSLFLKIFPVIYSDQRTSLLERGMELLCSQSISEDELAYIYKSGLLAKNIDWKYQNEWRLILHDSESVICDNSFNCKFFKIKKLYLGSKMPMPERMKIIEICKKKGIPYTGVITEQNKYKMVNCKGSCDNCAFKN